MEFRNRRTEEVVSSGLTLEQIASRFAETADANHWLWFWMVKHLNDVESAPGRQDMIAFLSDSFLYAIGMGLKNPMIRLHWDQRRYKIYLSRAGSICFKSGKLDATGKKPVGDEVYMGCLYSGRFSPNKERNLTDKENAFLERMSTDPVTFMAQCSKDMDRCCYCYHALEDKRSKDVGYGPICADRWGLPWGKTYDDKVPTFAQLWASASYSKREPIRGLCLAIRKDPYNPDLWEILGDALEEAGFQKRPEAPEKGTRIPRL